MRQRMIDFAKRSRSRPVLERWHLPVLLVLSKQDVVNVKWNPTFALVNEK